MIELRWLVTKTGCYVLQYREAINIEEIPYEETIWSEWQTVPEVGEE